MDGVALMHEVIKTLRSHGYARAEYSEGQGYIKPGFWVKSVDHVIDLGLRDAIYVEFICLNSTVDRRSMLEQFMQILRRIYGTTHKIGYDPRPSLFRIIMTPR